MHALMGLLVLACRKDASPDGVDRDVAGDSAAPADSEAPPDDPGDPPDPVDPAEDGALWGFIGSPCVDDRDCPYDGGACLTDGFPGGMCSQACTEFCPDEPGFPVTFCVDGADAPPDAAALGDGACFSRCDYALYPERGCRAGYGCDLRARPTGVEQYVCVPGADGEVSPCQARLRARGVSFTPKVIPDTSPATHPGLTCHVQDPVTLHAPLWGVELEYYDGTPTPNVTMSCEGAHALLDTVEDVAADGVVAVQHIGTYNCRVIAGTSTLSRHAYGDAIDLYGFVFNNGEVRTLVDHWEHDTTTFDAAAGAWLWDASHRWHDARIWNIILTPNYNAAHDNHFHVDLTPGSDFYRRAPWYYGPNLSGD